tara:strand:- start:33612 stop:34112 length:501 start_codon:yes stop_codon:yes gene_type:complete
MNFCDCGHIYDLRELLDKIDRERERERLDIVFGLKKMMNRSKMETLPVRAVEETFDLAPPEQEVEKPKKKLPGWMYAKMKKEKKAREAAQHDIQYRTQLNMFDGTTAGARNERRTAPPPPTPESYGDAMEGASGQKRRGRGVENETVGRFGLSRRTKEGACQKKVE